MKIILPVFWFLLIAFSINAVANQYEQKGAKSVVIKAIFLQQNYPKNSSNNKIPAVYLTEQTEENYDEDANSKANLFTLDSLSFLDNLFYYSKNFIEVTNLVEHKLRTFNHYYETIFIRFCCIIV